MCGYFDWSIFASLVVRDALHILVEAFAGPVVVLKATFEYCGIGVVGKYSLIIHMLSSLRRVLIGFCLGSLAGVILGLLMGRYLLARAIFNPIFRFIRPIPPIAWIPISIIWFGLGEEAKIFLIFLAAFANTTLNAMTGAMNVDPEVIHAARMFGAKERQIFTTVVIPRIGSGYFCRTPGRNIVCVGKVWWQPR